VLYAFGMAITVLHEGWHWLAARAEGVPARFRISYRGAFIVAETDLTLMLTVPRRRRFGPMLAGPAFDVSVLAVALGLRWAYFDAGAPVGDTTARLLGALVLAIVFNLVFQCAVFLRTDLYAMLACAMGCENLYRVSWLTLKKRLLPLSAAQADELRAASARDRSVASWFSLLYLAGMLGVFAFMLYIVLPSAAGFFFWMIKNIASVSFGQSAFWESVAVAALTASGLLAPIPLAIRERRLRRRGALS
jgi:putative peptide zinc metalloprotease protein